jgi:hypothetical protein
MEEEPVLSLTDPTLEEEVNIVIQLLTEYRTLLLSQDKDKDEDRNDKLMLIGQKIIFLQRLGGRIKLVGGRKRCSIRRRRKPLRYGRNKPKSRRYRIY